MDVNERINKTATHIPAGAVQVTCPADSVEWVPNTPGQTLHGVYMGARKSAQPLGPEFVFDLGDGLGTVYILAPSLKGRMDMVPVGTECWIEFRGPEMYGLAFNVMIVPREEVGRDEK